MSDQGRIRGVDRELVNRNGVRRHWRGRIRALTPNEDGYLKALCGTRTVYPHRAVMLAFVGPRPEGLVTLHADDDPNNNALTNLSYGTQRENVQKSVAVGTHVNARKTTCPNGHPYDGMNGPHRRCKQCHAANERTRHVHMAR